MARKRASERAFAQFLRLSSDEQEEFVRLAWQHDHNAVSRLKDEIAGASMDQLIELTERVDLELKLRRRTRKPSLNYDREIIRLKDKEKLTHGQIAKRIGKSYNAVRVAYKRAKDRMSRPERYR